MPSKNLRRLFTRLGTLKTKQSQLLILDLMMKHKHRRNLLLPLSNKHNVYISEEVRDIIEDAIDLVNFREITEKQREQRMN